jgi:hypothetical protein
MNAKVCRGAALAACVLLTAVLLLSLLGCGGSGSGDADGDTSGDGWRQGEEQPSSGESGEESGGGGRLPADRTIFMCGRSVLGGWFDHWGWDHDPQNPVRFGRYYLVYREMDVPPGIVDSAADAARAAAAAGSEAMFFKLCFADFAGGDEYSARENLQGNEDIVREVVETTVEEEGMTLILGNALPMVREYTDDWLVWNHHEYNRFLDELASEYGGKIVILDLYGTLAAPGGWLLPEYAADSYDSHLNDTAYDALDAELQKILGG